MTDREILDLIQTEAKRIADEVYSDKGTQYGVADVPAHAHTGVDTVLVPASSVDAFLPLPATQNGMASPGILGSQVINDPNQASNINLAGAFNSASIYVNPIPVVYGQGSGLLVMTGMPLSGATSATLTTAYPYATGTRTTIFTNPNSDSRQVLFTKGSTSITWTPGLSGNTTSTALGVADSPTDFAGGDAPVGTMVVFVNQDTGVTELWVRVNTVPGFSSGSFTLTGSVSSGATTATLTSSWAQRSGSYWIRFSSGEKQLGNFTSGSTSITFGAVTAAATSTITVSAVGWWGRAFNELLPTF
jgi:hypothetical protein